MPRKMQLLPWAFRLDGHPALPGTTWASCLDRENGPGGVLGGVPWGAPRARRRRLSGATRPGRRELGERSLGTLQKPAFS